MLKSTMARGLATLLLGFTALLAAPGDARAAVFVGAFDPPFGLDFPTLGFRGQGTFFVPDSCLLVDGIVTSDSCSAMAITSASVDFYNVPPPTGGPTIASQTFVPPPQFLSEIIVAGGNLIEAATGEIGPDAVSIPSIYSGPMWLQFLDGTNDEIGRPAGAYVLACSEPASCEFPDLRSDPAVVTFTRVPEPSSIALALAALGVGGFAWRRGRSTALR